MSVVYAPNFIAERADIFALIATLHETSRHLESLTAGEVDTVADSEGRPFVLRHVQEQLRHSDAVRQAAILDALPAHIALLDAHGFIVAVNRSWRRFAAANELPPPPADIGMNYLAVCDHATGDQSEAHQAAQGIRSVLDGGASSYSLEYICNSSLHRRWFLMMVTPLADSPPVGAVVMHLDISERKKAEQALDESRQEAHQKLIEASRQAGMAEVATSVLHNVGNVLNSVNVSASLVAEGITNSRAVSMARIAAMLREHEADLGAFLTEDPKGRHIPAFLQQIAQDWMGQQQAVVKEMGLLRANIDHIKEIVAMQQDHGKVAGTSEFLNVRELVEDSLRINSSAMLQCQVTVIRKFSEESACIVDRHKVLQILVNLVRNATHACEHLDEGKGRITAGVVQADGRIRITVGDNGVGISPQDLTRIFSHGFTTRKDGHGFGLHSAAITARELGGSLGVHSDGAGKGATFTLELPMTPAPVS